MGIMMMMMTTELLKPRDGRGLGLSIGWFGLVSV